MRISIAVSAQRVSRHAYATDAAARRIAAAAVDAGHDQAVPRDIRTFLYLPFGHSEDLADQDLSVALSRDLGSRDSTSSRRYRDIVKRFGRFPHRNAILGWRTTPEEQQFLDSGGFAG